MTTVANAGEDNCLIVNLDNSPMVILSGRITRDHRSVPKDSELVEFPGFYLKLDSPLRVGPIGPVAPIQEFTPFFIDTSNSTSTSFRRSTIKLYPPGYDPGYPENAIPAPLPPIHPPQSYPNEPPNDRGILVPPPRVSPQDISPQK